MLQDKPTHNYTGTRKRTYHLLIGTAMAMFEQGVMPSISELATEAGVSRATAYRYFPTQSDLITATVNESLGPILTWRPKSDKTEERISELINYSYPRMFEHEGALRAALQVSLQQWADTRSQHNHNDLKEKHFQRGNRKKILSMVTEPMESEFSPDIIDKTIKAFLLFMAQKFY